MICCANWVRGYLAIADYHDGNKPGHLRATGYLAVCKNPRDLKGEKLVD